MPDAARETVQKWGVGLFLDTSVAPDRFPWVQRMQSRPQASEVPQGACRATRGFCGKL